MAGSPDLRDQFLLRPDVIFLNHGSFGACPRPVFEAYQRWQEELERQPVEFFTRRYHDLMRSARQALGSYLGADADDLAYVPNATTAVNIVARSVPLGPGDEVVGTDHEYGAIDRAWRFVCADRGARYIRAAVPVPVRSAEDIVDGIWASITPRTRVLAISHITSPTALIFPVAELGRRARAAGIVTVIDGAHAPGQLSVDLEALGVDFYAGNCHKWLCAPKGSGFLFARREVQDSVRPLVVSWGEESEFADPSRFQSEFQWQGTRDVAGYLSVPEAIRFLREHDWDTVRARCHALARSARERLSAVTGLEPLSPDDPSWYAQMVSVSLPVEDARAAQRRLLEQFSVEVPVIAWNGRALLRVSVQGCNTDANVDALVDAVGAILAARGRGRSR